MSQVFRVSPLLAATSASPIEVVEHKGMGHPDTICDALVERFSVDLSRRYLDQFGQIWHHNVDKALLRAGVSSPRFGGGSIDEPIEIYVAGRATTAVDGVPVPVEDVLLQGARAWLREHLHALDVDRHVRIECLVRPGSSELVELYRRGAERGVWASNDTSIGVGVAPRTPLEATVAAVGARLAQLARNTSTPEIGEDVKVMGVRRGDRIHLTVSCALIDRFVSSLAQYREHVAALRDDLRSVAEQVGRGEVSVVVNAADDYERGSVYLTVSGTSAECGDDGQVGRGNRIRGLITPYRPMTLEAAAGKNPVTHVGKLYQLTAQGVADDVAEEVPGVLEAHCVLVSRIGAPIEEPQLVDLRVCLHDGESLAEWSPKLREIVDRRLGRLPELTRELVAGGVRVF